MAQRFIHAPTLSTSISSVRPRHQHLAPFSTSSTQWFRRFLSPKEEKQLYMGITALFREKLKEKSTLSNQSYSNIIDQVILGAQSTTPLALKNDDNDHRTSSSPAPPLTLKQLRQLKQDLDMAGKVKDVAQLETLWHQLQQAGKQIHTTMYNRLIRGFLTCPTPQGLALAKLVVDTMESQQHRLPTTRTCTYMIQAHLERRLPLDEARPYVAMLQHYSLNKLRTAFDCGVMLRYYIKCGNAHAIDFLWKDMMRHRGTIQPGSGLYTRYAEWLLSSHASLDMVADSARCFVQQFGGDGDGGGGGDAEEKVILTSTPGVVWTDYQISVWLKIALRLAHADNNHAMVTAYCVDADKLMLTLVNISNTLKTTMTDDTMAKEQQQQQQ